MPVQHITDAQFEEKVLKSDKPVLLDFYAEWCGPCKLAAPILDKMADELKDKLTILKIDVDENPATSEKYGVLSIPTIVLFKGEEIGRKVGFGGEKGYRDLIAPVVG
ncbi:MAG TPA: thioredoxin [Candidatus Saccharimonadia bacterium]|nr:thioredoxin [Candidatus Saccharimonadia bacterium]